VGYNALTNHNRLSSGYHRGTNTATSGKEWPLRPSPRALKGAAFREDDIMSIARITEISSTSEKSFEDAIQSAVTRATKTLRNVRGAWVKEQQIKIEEGKIVEYQVNLMITFVLEEGDQTDVA
jgi:flavin-binding protein dodecin